MPRRGVRSASGVRARQQLMCGGGLEEEILRAPNFCRVFKFGDRPSSPDLAAGDAELVHQLKFLPKFAA